MAIETTRWDITEHLGSEAEIQTYLAVVMEGGDGNEIRDALGHVARARGMTDLAKRVGVTRAGLYKALGEHGNPSFDLVNKLVRELGGKLSMASAREPEMA